MQQSINTLVLWKLSSIHDILNGISTIWSQLFKPNI